MFPDFSVMRDNSVGKNSKSCLPFTAPVSNFYHGDNRREYCILQLST